MHERPIRVLQVIGALNRGGTETWLVNVLKRVDRSRVQMDFLVQQAGDPELEAEVTRLGAEIIVCKRDALWPLRMIRAIRIHGPFDVLHSHRNAFGVAVLAMGKLAGVPSLIAHSHTAIPVGTGLRALPRKVIMAATRSLINRLADSRIAASNEASRYLFGREGSVDGDPRIIYCGVDIQAFKESVPSRPRWVKPDSTRKTIGHVGAFKWAKNHIFMIEVLSSVVARDSGWQLVLVGTGPLREEIEFAIQNQGLGDHVQLLGARNDVADILANQVDVFFFPSRYEGLGLAAVEAQLSGIPCLLSDVVPAEATVVPELVRTMSLSDPVEEWAEALITMVHEASTGSDRKIDMQRLSRLDIENSTDSLLAAYVAAARR